MRYFKCILLTASIIIVAAPSTLTYAQDTVVTSPVFVKIKLQKAGKIKGYITGITDSTVTIVPKDEWKNGEYDKMMILPAEKIAVISGKKTGGVTKLEGAGSGLLLGTLIGTGLGYKTWENNVAPNDNRSFFSSDEWKAGLYAGAVLGGVGLLVGIISEGKHKTKRFKIKGSRLMLKYRRFEILSQ